MGSAVEEEVQWTVIEYVLSGKVSWGEMVVISIIPMFILYISVIVLKGVVLLVQCMHVLLGI